MYDKHWEEKYPHTSELYLRFGHLLKEIQSLIHENLSDYNYTRNFFYFLQSTNDKVVCEENVLYLEHIPIKQIDVLYEELDELRNFIISLWNRYKTDMPYFCVTTMAYIKEFTMKITKNHVSV